MQNYSEQKDSADDNWIVLKFGGSSVGEAKHWQTIVNQVLINLSKGLRPLLVLSALKNVSNLLEALLHQALAGVHPIAIEHLKEMHHTFAAQLGLEINDHLTPWFKQLENDCDYIFQTKQITPKLHASILSVGELLSTTIGAQYLRQNSKLRHSQCVWFDARKALKSKQSDFSAGQNYRQNVKGGAWHHFTSAQCSYDHSLETRSDLENISADIIVTQGFIASDQNDHTVLLGREGSDTSAAYFGAIVNATEIQIWTDVPGVFSCNPQENNQARLLPHLNYVEARQMAQFGAKVLHPRAIKPAQEKQIPLLVKSTHQPDSSGTRINSQQCRRPSIKAIVSEPKVISISILSESVQTAPNDKIIQTLLALGYEIILDEPFVNDSNSSRTTILRYTNSDIAEPKLTDLSSLLNQENERVTICSELCLLSVIGQVEQTDWTSNVEQQCAQKKQFTQPTFFKALKQGRISLLIPENDLQLWEQLLHKNLIEDNHLEYGESWLSLL